MEFNRKEQFSDSRSDLHLVFNELKQIQHLIRKAKNLLVKEAPVLGYIMRENDQYLTDLFFNDKTLTVRFYHTWPDKAENSYILFAIVDGCIDNDGDPMPSNPGRIRKIDRYDLILEDGYPVWRNQEDNSDETGTEELTNRWLDYFRAEALKDLKLSDIFQYLTGSN